MAARSTCPKCGHFKFETVLEEPKGSKFKLLFTRCADCGAVVGVSEYFNIGARLGELAKKLGVRLED